MLLFAEQQKLNTFYLQILCNSLSKSLCTSYSLLDPILLAINN